MVKNHKLLIKDDHGSVSLRDNDGLEVSFNTITEFNFYTGLSFPLGIVVLAYEPSYDDENVYVQWDGEEGVTPTADQINSLIDNIDLFKTRKASRTWGLEGQALTDMEDLMLIEGQEKQRYSEISESRNNDGWKTKTLTEIRDHIDSKVVGTNAQKIEELKKLVIKLAIRTL